MSAIRLALSTASIALGVLAAGCVALAWLGVDVGEALAQTSTTAMEIPAGFEPVPGGKPKTEEVNASYLVIGAYAAFALGFVGYLFQLAKTQSRLAADIQELGARIERRQRGE